MQYLQSLHRMICGSAGGIDSSILNICSLFRGLSIIRLTISLLINSFILFSYYPHVCSAVRAEIPFLLENFAAYHLIRCAIY